MNVWGQARMALGCTVIWLLASGLSVPGTMALLAARTGAVGSTFSTAALGPPTALTATPSGRDVVLTWAAGTNGNAYAVRGVANGTSSSCGTTSPTSVGTTSTTAHTDVGRSTPQGTWFCYEVLTTFAGWTSVQMNPRAAAQLGVVASAVTVLNAGQTTGCAGGTFGVAGRLDCGDQVIVTFNQPINPASGPQAGNTVCANRTSGLITLASTGTSGACTTSEAATNRLGSLSGSAVTGADARHAATYAWSNANRTVTVTVGARISQTAASVSSTMRTLNPTTSLTNLTSATGGFHTCDNNTAGGSCLPVATSSL